MIFEEPPDDDQNDTNLFTIPYQKTNKCLGDIVGCGF
jgi:hypothetical protein